MADPLPETTALRDRIERQTCGQPANRACLPGSDDKWEGYLLGIEEAIAAAEGASPALTTEAGMVLHALRDETVQRVVGVVMGLPLEDVRAAADELNAEVRGA